MRITETDLEILRKCFLDSLGVIESEFLNDHRFLLKEGWNRNSGKTIGVLKGDTYYIYGYPKTNHDIILYLKEHGYPNIVSLPMSDEPSKKNFF